MIYQFLIAIGIFICTKLLSIYIKRFKPVVYYHNTKRNHYLIQKTTHLQQYTDIPLWGLNGHLQSLYASQFRKGPPHQRNRIDIQNEHGFFSIHSIIDDLPAKSPIICFVPGIAGHVDNDYVKNFVQYFYKHGFKTVVFNWPGCGDSPTYKNISILGETSNIKKNDQSSTSR